VEHFTTVGGRTVRYLEQGAGQPLVLLHAFPVSADMWRPQLAAAPAGWRFIAPDLRGFGGSSRVLGDGARQRPVPATTIDDYARDVLALMEAVGIDSAVIGGLSMGGYVAFALYRLAPRCVRALVLADTRPEADTEEGRMNRLRLLATIDAFGSAGVAETMVPKLIAPSTRRDRPELDAQLRHAIEASDVDGLAEAVRCMMSRPDSTHLLEQARVPIQLVVGRDDALTPVAVHEQMQLRSPGAALTIVEDAGHLSNLERPEVFNRTLSRFLASLP
jgi:pimeloyl-ACP methyl ester carboxylesterase